MAAEKETPISRSKTKCPLLGMPESLKEDVLPTVADVLKHYLHLHHTLKVSKKEPQGLVTKVIDDVLRIWERSSLPTISKQRATEVFQKHFQQYKNLLKVPVKRRNTDKFKANAASFVNKSETLFDLATFKCSRFDNCNCTSERKIPYQEQCFLQDQRTTREMFISHAIDKASSLKKRRILDRRSKDYVRCLPKPVDSESLDEIVMLSSSSTSDENEDSCASDFESSLPNYMKEKKGVTEMKKVQRNVSLSNFAVACDRVGVSSRAAATIASAVIDDLTVGKEMQVIDKSKVMRARTKSRNEALASIDFSNIKNIYFDGRKDLTLKLKESNNKKTRTEVTEEHVTLIAEPGNIYLGHIVPNSGSARDIVKSILSFTEENHIDLENIEAIGCDGTNVNTGWRAGIIKRLEEHLKRPLHWAVCQLHANELPLRHLLVQLDGKTSGPQQFTGPIGKALANIDKCENLPIVQFCAIPSEDIAVSDDLRQDLSSDQKYLLDLYLAVSKGECSSAVAARTPGKMAHSRWLTTASQALRLYVSSEEPSDNLKKIVKYIMFVYVPVWFAIKCQPTISQAARHAFKMISKCQQMEEDIQEIVMPVLERNSFGAHSESILVAMLTDDNLSYKELAWRRILRIREESRPTGRVRTFRIPTLNRQATNYTELIDWKNTHEPIFTKQIETDEIKSMIKSKEFPNDIIPPIPCHTQAVERHIKIVTEASASVVGVKNRDGFIMNKLKSRSVMPKFDSKCDFKSLM